MSIAVTFKAPATAKYVNEAVRVAANGDERVLGVVAGEIVAIEFGTPRFGTWRAHFHDAKTRALAIDIDFGHTDPVVTAWKRDEVLLAFNVDMTTLKDALKADGVGLIYL